MDNVNKYMKGAIYSSGIALAMFGYLFKDRIREKQSKTKVVFGIYYPLFLQYPAALDLYFGLVSIERNKLLLSTTFISTFIIPYIHSKIHFSKPEQYETKKLVTSLFNESNKLLLTSSYFYTFCALTLSSLWSYYAHSSNGNKQSFEIRMYQKCGLLAVCYFFDRIVEKMKNFHNPQLIHTANDALDDNKHNYGMHLLFDMNESEIPSEIASLCVEYCTGYGLMTINDANRALSVIIYDKYAQSEHIKELKDSEDTRFVQELNRNISNYRKDKGGDDKLAKMWIKNKMVQIYSVKPIYAFMLCLTTQSISFNAIKRLLYES